MMSATAFDHHKARILKLLSGGEDGGDGSHGSGATKGAVAASDTGSVDTVHDLRDRSPKGSLDAPIVDLVHLLNRAHDYVTTSSCSGRVALFAQDEHRWLYVVHDECTLKKVAETLSAYYAQRRITGAGINHSSSHRVVLMKTEPFILHVMCRSIASAQSLLQVARNAGFRESGISVGKNKIICAVRTTGNSMEVPLTPALVHDEAGNTKTDYLQFLVDYGNSLFRRNSERIALFQKSVRETFVEGQMISVPSIANEKQVLGDNHSTKANKTVSQSRLKRWNHAAASDPEFNLLVVFGGYGPDVRGRVCRQNDVLVAWARPDEVQYDYGQARRNNVNWMCPKHRATPGAQELAPSPRVRHTMTHLTSFVDNHSAALVSIYLVYGGRASPQRGMHDAWLLCVILSQESEGTSVLVADEFFKAVKYGPMLPSVSINIKWIPLNDYFVLWQPGIKQNRRVALTDEVAPKGRWSHSATLVPSMASSKHESFVLIYGGRDASSVLSDCFCFVVNTPQAIRDVDDPARWRARIGKADHIVIPNHGGCSAPIVGRFSHTSSYAGRKDKDGSSIIAMVGGCRSLSGKEEEQVDEDDIDTVIVMNIRLANMPGLESLTVQWRHIRCTSSVLCLRSLKRYSHSAVVVAAGRLLIIGGISTPRRENAESASTTTTSSKSEGGILSATGVLLDVITDTSSFLPVSSVPDGVLLCRHKMVATYNRNSGNLKNLRRKRNAAFHVGHFSESISIWCIGGGSEVLSFGGCFSEPPVLKCRVTFAGPFVDVTDEQRALGFVGGAAASSLKLCAVPARATGHTTKSRVDKFKAQATRTDTLEPGHVANKASSIPVLAVESKFVKTAKTMLERKALLHKGLRIAKMPGRGPKWRALPLEIPTINAGNLAAMKEFVMSRLQQSDAFREIPDEAFDFDVLPTAKQIEESKLASEDQSSFQTFKASKSLMARERSGHNAKEKLVERIYSVLKGVTSQLSVNACKQEIRQNIPKKFERLGGVLMVPPNTFRNFEMKFGLSPKQMANIWDMMAGAGSVDRIVRHAEIDKGRMRQSRSEVVFDRHGEGSWISVKENGVKYGFDCEKVMYCTSNGTEKRRVGKLLQNNRQWHRRRTADMATGLDHQTFKTNVNKSKSSKSLMHDCDDYRNTEEQVTKMKGRKHSQVRLHEVESDEVIVDLYAGIGYFTLPYLVIGHAKHVHACEINPDSVAALRRNLVANKINEDRCTVWPGDNAETVAAHLLGVADRVNMGLIPSCEDALHLGVAALRIDRGGWLHVHGNAPRKDRSVWAEHIVSLVRDLLIERVMLSGWKVVCTHIEKVKAYAPRVDHLVCDVWAGPCHAVPFEVVVYETKKRVEAFRKVHMREKEKAKRIEETTGSKAESQALSAGTESKSVPLDVPVNIMPCHFQGEEELIAIRDVFKTSMTVVPRHASVDKYVKSQLQGHLKDMASARKTFTSETSKGSCFWVAESNGGIVGCIGILRQQDRAGRFHAESRVDIKHMCVSKNVRGRGIGRRLLEVAIKKAREEVPEGRLVAETLGHESMAAARRLYTRCGFEEKHRRHMGKGRNVFELVTFEFIVRTAHVSRSGTEMASISSNHEENSSTPASSAHANDEILKASGSPLNVPSPSTHRLAKVSASVPTWESGSKIVLKHVASGLTVNLLVECVKNASPSKPDSRTQIKLAPIDLPYHRLTVSQRGKVSWSTKSGRAAAFSVVERGHGPVGSGGVLLSLCPVSALKKKNRKGAIGCCVGIDLSTEEARILKLKGQPHSFASSSLLPQSRPDISAFVAQMVPDAALTESESILFLAVPFRKVQQPQVPNFIHPPLLSSISTGSVAGHSDISSFVRDGYAIFPSAVGTAPLAAAKAFINRKLGTPGALVQGGVQPNTGKLDGAAAGSPELLDLLLHPESDALRIVESFIGAGNLRRPTSCQVALRFPERLFGDGSGDMNGRQWHVDGMRQGKRNPFTLLVGIALSECSSALSGNFTVFPGSHHIIHSLILDKGRLRGVDEFRLWSVATDPSNPWCAPDKGIAAKTLKEAATLRKSLGKDNGSAADGSPPLLPDLGTPKQLMLKPGDVVIAYPKLAHRGAPNFSPNIRYMCYFRLRHIDQQTEELQSALVNDMWADLEGITPSDVKMASSPEPAVAPELPAPGAPHFPGGILSTAQIDFFRTNGYIVVPDVLSPEQVLEAKNGMNKSLLDHAGVDASSLEQLQKTKMGLKNLSSTNGAGGVLDLFYERWKMRITLENKAYAAICKELYASTYASYDAVGAAQDGEDPDSEDSSLWSHPYGNFDPMAEGIWAHIDRIGFRVPDAVAELTEGNDDSGPKAKILSEGVAYKSKKGKKTLIQRSLTPHLDCCPNQMYSGGGKAFPRWRPIQCFLSLSQTKEKNHGGFECVPGFHREFEKYYQEKLRSRQKNDKEEEDLPSLPCVGDYVHIRPKADAEVIRRFVHVPVPAGAAVFWDQRLPHANARKNQGNEPRSVVYGGFLPRGEGIGINKAYAKEQLRRLKEGRVQADFWLNETRDRSQTGESRIVGGEALFKSLSADAVNMLT